MPVTFSTTSPLRANELDIPDPGPAPKDDVETWWPVFQFLRKPDPDALEKAKARARWAWVNCTRYEKLRNQAQLEHPELEATCLGIQVEHLA